jgi:Tol biopolymer transport system component
MQRDIRATDSYRETEALVRRLRQPGSGRISDAADVDVAPDGRHAVFAGMMADTLEHTATRICTTDLETGDTRVHTFGPLTDRLPKFAPDGASIAFLSDRHEAGDFQLYLLDRASGAVRAAPHADGWVETHHWSPDGAGRQRGIAISLRRHP